MRQSYEIAAHTKTSIRRLIRMVVTVLCLVAEVVVTLAIFAEPYTSDTEEIKILLGAAATSLALISVMIATYILTQPAEG